MHHSKVLKNLNYSESILDEQGALLFVRQTARA
jgi:hypothetical protein